MSIIFQGDLFSQFVYQLFGPPPDTLAFDGGVYLSTTYQTVPTNEQLISFQVAISEIRAFTYVITAVNDDQGLRLARLINPTTVSLPNNVTLLTGPVQKSVYITSITDSVGNVYPIDVTIPQVPTPSVSYVLPSVTAKIYMVNIQDTRHVNYSFLATTDTFEETVSTLNPSLTMEPSGGRKTISPFTDVINVLQITDITNGANRTIYIGS